VTSEAGYVPKPGVTIATHGLEFEILRSDDKRVELVRIRRDGAGEKIGVNAEELF